MREPDTQTGNKREAQESIDIDDVLELGELSETKGGWGVQVDNLGGLVIP